MKNLLLATSVVAFVFFKACGSNCVKKDGGKDSLSNENSKVDIQNSMDTTQSTQSGTQSTDPRLGNQQNGVNGDTSKIIHFHGVPNQHELDSIKKAKTKLKSN